MATPTIMKNLRISMVLLFFSCYMASQEPVQKTIWYKGTNGKIINQASFDALKKEIVAEFNKMGKQVRVLTRYTQIQEQNDTVTKNYDLEIIALDKDGKDLITGFTPDFGNNLLKKKIPNAEFTTLDGTVLKFNRISKPTVINFWFTRCKPCIDEMPILNYYKEKYHDKIDFVAITFDDEDKVKQFLEKITFNYTHVVNAKTYVDELHIAFYPTFLYLNEKGVVKYNSGNISYVKNEDGSVPEVNSFFEELLLKLL